MIKYSKLTLVMIMIIGLAGIGVNLVMRQKSPSAPASTATPQPSQTDQPQIVSTKPDPLEQTIISTSEIVEITFNKPLENAGEFKSRLDPKINYKVELSSDRKTAKIIPEKPYQLGTTYTLFILPDSKFDGGGRLEAELIFHYNTVRYRGI